MATYTFRVKYSKTKDQQFVTLRKSGGDNISGATSFTAYVYTTSMSDPYNTYVLTNTEMTEFKSTGYTQIAMSDLVGAGASDAWYTVVLAEGTTYASLPAGFGLTIQATAKVYAKQGYIGVYDTDYRLDEFLHTIQMLLTEMNAIEDIEVSHQKREDFEIRLAMLKKTLKYS